jgi:hypothetical protein
MDNILNVCKNSIIIKHLINLSTVCVCLYVSIDRRLFYVAISQMQTDVHISIEIVFVDNTAIRKTHLANNLVIVWFPPAIHVFVYYMFNIIQADDKPDVSVLLQ